MSDHKQKKQILFIFPGPRDQLTLLFEKKLVALSGEFTGRVVTTGYIGEEARFGNFKIFALKSKTGRGTFTNLKLLFSVLKHAHQMKKNNGLELIITYDPLKTGLYGYIAKALFGSLLAVEVNGDYTSKENYNEVTNPLLRWLRRQLFLILEKAILKRADGIKTLYVSQLDYFKIDYKKKILRNYSNWVDLSKFTDLGDNKEILFIGSPYKLKGVDLLIKAFRRISTDYPLWTLKIVGWFPNKDEVINDIGDGTSIILCDPVERSEVPSVIGCCGILVLPSRTEAMGRVLLEAMACRKACVGSNAGGIPSVITDGVNGFLFEVGNDCQLESALRKLLDSDTLRHEFGTNGLNKVKTDFSSGTYFGNSIEFYNSVIDA